MPTSNHPSGFCLFRVTTELALNPISSHHFRSQADELFQEESFKVRILVFDAIFSQYMVGHLFTSRTYYIGLKKETICILAPGCPASEKTNSHSARLHTYCGQRKEVITIPKYPSMGKILELKHPQSRGINSQSLDDA